MEHQPVLCHLPKYYAEQLYLLLQQLFYVTSNTFDPKNSQQYANEYGSLDWSTTVLYLLLLRLQLLVDRPAYYISELYIDIYLQKNVYICCYTTQNRVISVHTIE